MRGETPKSRHRAAAAELHRNDAGMVRCALEGTEGHRCEGRLECHHPVEAQHLKKLHQRATFYGLNPSATMDEPGYYARLRTVTADDLVADARNSCWLCTLGHRQVELHRFELPRLPLVEEFAREYDIGFAVPDWAEDEAA